MTDVASVATRAFSTAGSLPAIPGLALRHLRPPEDYAAMNAIANAVRQAEGMAFYTTDEQLRLFYETLDNTDLLEDVAIVEVDGRIVGYGRAGWRDELDGTRIHEIVAFVEPAADAGIFRVLVEALELRATRVAAGLASAAGARDRPAESLLEANVGDNAAEREGILRDRGYEAVRHFYSMIRPTLDDIDDAPLPDGLEIREVRAEHLPLIWAADNEAFRDHWGYSEPTESAYEQFLNDPVMSDSSLWRVAWDGDQVAGQVRSFINDEENERFGRLRGYTEHISVRRPWRRRGLARALIAASFPLLRARGMTEAALGVDTENPSGALRVYESLGFRPVSRETTFRKSLEPARLADA